MRRLCCLLLLAATAGPALAAPLNSPAAHGAVQMTRGPQNHLLVPVTINGHVASFLLDTGIRPSFLQNNRAAAFGLRARGRQTQIGDRSFAVAAAATFRLGHLSLGQTELALYDPAHFRGPIPGQGGKAADGLLGLEFLRRHRAIINCRTRQLFLRGPSARRLRLAETTRDLGFTRIPIHESTRGFLSVPCRFGGKSGALVIDTGAFVTVINEADARARQLEQAPSRLTARTAGGRVRPIELAQIDDLQIGGVPVAPQPFAVMDLYTRKPLRAFSGLNRLQFYDPRRMKARLDIVGLLGNELLYQHHAIIDLESMSLFLK